MKTIATFFLSSCLISPAWICADDRGGSENPTDPSRYSAEHRLIFHAVLEGLYEDGVAGEALDQMIPDIQGMLNQDQPEKTNFVYTCPVCSPAFEALRLYKVRSPFSGQKGTRYTTFGQGLPEELLTRLKGLPQDRRDAIEELIQKWVKRRLDLMALTPAERTTIEENLKQMKKDGEAALKRFQKGGNGGGFVKYYASWKKCPACEGAVAAPPE